LLSRVESNLLPLINLVFLLLMFFIAVGQMSPTPLPDLPGSKAQQAPKQPRADLVVKVPVTGLLMASQSPRHNYWIFCPHPMTRRLCVLGRTVR